MVFGYYLSVGGYKIANVLENFYTYNIINKTNYFKELLLEFKFLKYFFKIKKSDLSLNFERIFYSMILGVTFAVEYYYSLIYHFSSWFFILTLIAFSFLYIGIITDIKTKLLPDVFITIPSIIFILLCFNTCEENIKYFLMIYFLSYIVYFIQIKADKFFIGIQDVKLYALGVLLYGISSLTDIIYLSSLFSLFIFLYKYIKQKTHFSDFGLFIYITLVIYPFYLLIFYNNR